MDINTLRKTRPELAGLDDDQVVDAIHQAYYPDLEKDQVAGALGVKLAATPSAAKVPDRNLFGYVNDQMINAANSAAAWVKSGIDLVSPDSSASASIGDFIKMGEEHQSDKQKFLNKKLQDDLQGADGEWGKVKAYGQHILDDPSGVASQAAGNIGPFGAMGGAMQAAKLTPVVESAISMGTAGALSAGEVRGNIWQQVSSMSDADLLGASPEYRDLRAGGASEADAKREIGANLSRNWKEVGTIGLLGVLSGKYGVEAMATGVAPKMGHIASAAVGGLSEGLEGGAEQLATNVGLKGAIPSTSLSNDVGLNAFMEGSQGGFGGAMAGGHHSPGDAIRATKHADDGPLARAANAGIEFDAQAADQMLAGAKQGPAPLEIQDPQAQPDGIPFEADPRFASAPMFNNGSAPQAQVYGSKQAADIAIGEQGLMGTHVAARNSLGQYEIQAADPLGEIQRRVQGETQYTTPAGVDQVRNAIEDAWLQANVDAPATQSQAGPAAQSGTTQPQTSAQEFDPTPGVDAKVRERRILDAAQVILDGEQVSAVQVIGKLNTSLKRIGETPLSMGERARLVRMLDATAGFRGASEQSPIPSPAIPATDRGVDNSAMEALIPERKAKVQPGDRLNPKGEPFKTKAAAVLAAKKTPGEVAPVEGGFVVRPPITNTETANGSAGNPTGVSGIDGAQRTPDAGPSLESQRDGADVRGGGQPDGNGPAVDAGGSVLGASGDSAVVDGGTGGVVNQAVTTKPAKQPKAKKHPSAVRGSTALAEVSRALGGISPDLMSDLSEKVQRTRTSKSGKKTQYTTWDNPAIPGVGPLFRSGGNGDIAEIARVLEDSGYLTPGSIERDPIGASQRAQEIIKAELRQGGATLREGDADAVAAEARARQEAAMDEIHDPWDDFSFTPDDLDEAGYTKLNAELQSEVERLLAEADQAGLDTEAIREEVARQVGEEASQDDYNTAVKQTLQGILARADQTPGQAESVRPQQGGRDGIEAAGDQGQAGERSPGRQSGSDAAEGLTLQAQTSEDLKAKAEREDAATKAEAAKKATEQERLLRQDAERDNKARADQTVDDFQLGQSADQQLSGMGDLFAQQADPGASRGDEARVYRPAPVAQSKPDAKIEDFGEKLAGARKDYAAKLKDSMDVDAAAEPLSKSWPEPDYQKLLEGGSDPFTVAFIHAARDEIPTKPVKAWKLKGWVDGVKTLRGMANSLFSGDVSVDQLRQKLVSPEFTHVRNKVGGRAELYQIVGHSKSLKGVTFEEHFYSLYRGEKNVHKWSVEQQAKATAFSNWPREIVVADTKDEAIEAFKAKYGELDLGAKAKGQPQFIIYRKRGQDGAFIGKKIGREHIDLKKVADVKEARTYLENNTADLERALERYKSTPMERRADNAPRVGDDHRNGAPVTPEAFADTFGFRGVQFGNYVEQGRRQSDLNETYDALMDLAAVLGVDPRALSLNGGMGLAFGARGKGGKNAPAAHFEPTNLVINLTKGGGPGSLAHEWWHAADNYFARQSVEKSTDFVTDGAVTTNMRRELREAFASVKAATTAPTLRRRSAELDKRRSKPYWNTPLELSARAFESYVIAKLQDQGAANDYLANIADPEVWGIAESMRSEALGGKDEPTYPYPLQAELPAVRAAFDDFFKTVETKGDDAGNVAMFSRTDDQAVGMAAVDLRKALEPIASAWKGGPSGGVNVVATVADLPAKIQEAIRSSGAEGEARAFYLPNTQTVYLIADRLSSVAEAQFALLHEVYGHHGLRSLLGDGYAQAMTSLRRANPQLSSEASMWMAQYGKGEISARVKAGMDQKAAEREVRLLSTEEAMSDRAGSNEPLKGWKFVAAKLQAFLRRVGLDQVADWMESHTEAETLDLLARARRAVKQGVPMADEFMGQAVAASRGQGAVFSRSTLAGAMADSMNSVKDVSLPAGYKVADFIKSDGKLSWWHKTVGTQYNLAQRSPKFKKVFDSVQNFLNDVSAYATEAADLAPTILPKLEDWKDLTKNPISAQDTKAIAAPIFEGTLSWTRDESGRPVKTQDIGTAGIVWTDAELRGQFGLNDDQVGLYREFRQATDRSLTKLAISDMIRYAGADAKAVADKAMSMEKVGQAAKLLRDHLLGIGEENPGRADSLAETAGVIEQKADRAKDLMARGYAPLSRFGQYTVYVTKGSEQLYFGMFESKAEANRMARQMRAEHPDADIEHGTVSQEAFKLFAGVSPETLELFGDMLGLEGDGSDASSQAFQTYLKLAKANRSAMKRLIERKGVAGFSEDAGRVLAGFVYSNARQTASNLHMGDMTSAANEIPNGEGELKDAAVRLTEYVKNPQEEAQGLRGLLFAQYLGGSVASAMVNATQPVAVTLPYLSQWGGIKEASAQMVHAFSDALKSTTGDAKLDAAFKHAEDEGIVSPQEVHQLMAQAGGKGSLKSGDGTAAGNAAAFASNSLSKASLAWGKVFGLAEQFNRKVTFIAAYRTAAANGIENPADFAAKAIAETQFVYNKGNKPRWARGAVGSVAFTFKQYSVSYVELLSRMANNDPEGRKAALLALGVLFMMSGADGLPFAQDIEDVIDGLMQRLGYNFSTKQAKQEFFASVFGQDGGRFVEKGISGLPGVPIDLSGRMGMGNLIPATGLLLKKQDHSRDIAELAGPSADLIKRAGSAAGQLLNGEVSRAVVTMSPVAARNLAKAYDMATTGMYRDDKGSKVLDATGYEALAKAIGFQPNDVARIQDATGQAQQMIALNKIRTDEISSAWAKGLFEQDQDQIQRAREMRDQWNKDNPESPIRIKMQNIIKRVKSMREDKATRIEKTAPKAIRRAVRDELAGASS
jgi:hypothetical protein